MNRRSLAWYGVLVALTLSAYWPSITGPYYEDDYQFVFLAPAASPFHYFAHPNPNNPFYRPIQCGFNTLVQRAGPGTWPIHVVTALVHAGLALLVLMALLALGYRRRVAVFAALLTVLSQAAVLAVAGNDTLSQVLGTACGYLSVWAFYAFVRGEPGRGIFDRRFGAGLLLLALSLFSKETSAGFVPLAVLTLLIDVRRLDGWGRRVGVIVPRLLAITAISALYLLLRARGAPAGVNVAPELYGIHFGANLVKNLAMLWVSAMIPFSSVRLFQAQALGANPLLAGYAAAAAALVTVVAAGLWQHRRDARVWWILVAGTVSVSVALPIAHVSELYSYQLIPAAAALIAIGLAGAEDASRGRGVPAVLWKVVAVVVLIANASATVEKSGQMDACGRRARALLAQLAPRVRALPPGGELVLVNPPPTVPAYSVFAVNGFNVLHGSEQYVARMAGRSDVTVHIAERGEGVYPSDRRVVLTLDDGVVRKRGSIP